MRRRRLLQMAGLVAGGGTLTFGSGAFTSVSAQRSVDVAVVDDNDAYLKFDATSEYVRATGASDQIRFYIPGLAPETGPDGDVPDGAGVNPGSTYTFANLFDITNQGADSIEVFSTSSNLPPEFDRIALVGGREDELLAGEDRAMELSPGQTKSAGLFIETAADAEPTNGRVSASLTITADPPDENNPSEPWTPSENA